MLKNIFGKRKPDYTSEYRKILFDSIEEMAKRKVEEHQRRNPDYRHFYNSNYELVIAQWAALIGWIVAGTLLYIIFTHKFHT